MRMEEAVRKPYAGSGERVFPPFPEPAIPGVRGGFYVRYGKRALDVGLAAIGLAIGLPIILLFAVLIVLETEGPAFYVQERVGLRGRPFRVIKLRSMVADAEKDGARWADKNDSRVT
jgi:lipopolysaccharide/colanic/teichoic acid biosynthesis glycosyltransferase